MASRLLVFWSHFWAPFTRALDALGGTLSLGNLHICLLENPHSSSQRWGMSQLSQRSIFLYISLQSSISTFYPTKYQTSHVFVEHLGCLFEDLLQQRVTTVWSWMSHFCCWFIASNDVNSSSQSWVQQNKLRIIYTSIYIIIDTLYTIYIHSIYKLIACDTSICTLYTSTWGESLQCDKHLPVMLLSTWYTYVGDGWWLCLSHISVGWLVKGRQILPNIWLFLAIADINFRIHFLSVIKRVSTKIENLILTYSFPTGSEMCFSIRILLLFSFCMSRYGTERQHIYIYIVSA